MSRKYPRRKKLYLLSITLISLIIFNSLLFCFIISSPSNKFQDKIQSENEFNDFNSYLPKTQAGAPASIFQDPYTINFSEIWNFFKANYRSNLTLSSEIDTFYREGDSDGDISNFLVYSIDNLLLYNTLKKFDEDLNSSEIYDSYLDLKSTDLWYEGENQYDYGFIESVDTESETQSTRRNLIDNLMPIMLLVDNMPQNPKFRYIESIVQILDLINSSQFWNSTNKYFKDYNSSTGDIYAESNLYAILATLKVYQNENFNTSIKNQAFTLANETMNMLTKYFWDEVDYGYYYRSNTSFSFTNDGEKKYLKTNALGILALIEFWLITEDIEYLRNASRIFDKAYGSIIRDGDLYHRDVGSNWGGAFTTGFDLYSNSFMMMALLKLFDISANISYYNNATAMYETLQNDFYDFIINAYDKTDTSANKNFLYNLRLTEAYLEAFELYKKVSIFSQFNRSESSSEFILNQDDLILKANYTFESQGNLYNIPDANITYQLYYPNGTWFYEETHATNENGTDTFSFTIDDSLLIGENYSIIIWANTTYFSYTSIVMEFSISSGIKYISGLENLGSLLQGESKNISLVINNSRDNDINLNLSLATNNEITSNSPRVVFLNSSEENSIWIQFSIINSAELGSTDFHFLLKNGTTVFLNYTKQIEIRNSLYLSEIAYDREVVKGDMLYISLNLVNFLSNESQSFNISFLGKDFENFKKEYTLLEGERITITKNLNISESIDVDSLELNMIISKSETIFYNQSFIIQLVDKLEVIDASFPSSITQGSSAKFVLRLRNNKRTSETFSLYINGQLIKTDLIELAPGENIIETSVVPSINPYDFSVKSYEIIVEDSEGNKEFSFYYEVQILLSIMNLFLFYILPILIGVAIVLYFKNKEIKTKLLRR